MAKKRKNKKMEPELAAKRQRLDSSADGPEADDVPQADGSAPGPKRMRISLALIGFGGVAKSFIPQLQALALRRDLAVRLCYISTSTRAIYPIKTTADRLSVQTFTDFFKDGPTGDPKTPEALAGLVLGWKASTKIIVDCTSSQSVAENYPLWLAKGITILTPNKKAFSSTQTLWDSLQSTSYPSNPYGGYLYHESTVGAGLPLLTTLHDLLSTGDEIHRIEGIFSGTMSYLFNSFQPVAAATSLPAWHTTVLQAKEKGFTEPDPRDDLNGMDVARKCAILARLCGTTLTKSPTDGAFPVESLIPDSLAGCDSTGEYLARLSEQDASMAGRRAAAEKEGMVLRYVGCVDVEKKEIMCGLKAFEKDHPIAALKGSDNIFNIYTRRYGDNPLIIQGAGAGNEVTAMGITADLCRVLDRVDGK